jgi:large subunit ribosomal protein L25
LPKDIPESITVDIENLDLGSSIHLSDLDPPENVKFLAPENTVLVTVTAPKAEIEEEEEEELEEGLEEGEEGLEEGEEVEGEAEEAESEEE